MKKMWKTLVALLAGMLCVANAQVQVDPDLPEYTPVSGVSGTLNSVGSDTLNNLMTFWAEDFCKFYPNVKIQIEGKGSSTAPPALIEGTSQLGPMSRAMKSKEIDSFELALAQALERLIAVRHPCTVESNFETTRQMLALAILEAAADGERNPQILANHALDRLHDD